MPTSKGYLPDAIIPYKDTVVIDADPKTIVDPENLGDAVSEFAGKDSHFRSERIMLKFSTPQTLSDTVFVSFIVLSQEPSGAFKEYEWLRVKSGTAITTIVLDGEDAGGNFGISEEIKIEAVGFAGDPSIDIQIDKGLDF